ncbi:MAG TPA: hypothetical protein VGG10_01835 [Rhizomicrobium sp.]|jgi:ABC-type phosphate transport system permease subunit
MMLEKIAKARPNEAKRWMAKALAIVGAIIVTVPMVLYGYAYLTVTAPAITHALRIAEH